MISPPTPPPPVHKVYLTLKELQAHISIPKKTIDNWCSDGTWKLGVHFINPTGRKRFYHWPNIEKWLKGEVIE